MSFYLVNKLNLHNLHNLKLAICTELSVVKVTDMNQTWVLILKSSQPNRNDLIHPPIALTRKSV